MGQLTKEKIALGISADQTNPGTKEDNEKFQQTLYRKGGVHRGPKGAKYSYVGASSKQELEDLEEEGWSLNFKEALFGVRKPQELDRDNEKEAMAEKIKELQSKLEATNIGGKSKAHPTKPKG